MKCSLFTPTHDTRFLPELWSSISCQTYENWEWIILVNGPVTVAEVQALTDFDSRVIVLRSEHEGGFVGAYKLEACTACSGDLLVEVDHDDFLVPTALETLVWEATEHPKVGFFYSDAARFTTDDAGRRISGGKFNEGNGWRYRERNGLLAPRAFRPFPSSVSRIWYAPDHLRAWRVETYWLAGGHNPEMRVLDDQDLLARTYLHTDFHHIDQVLYFYRIHGENSWLKHNQEIQSNVLRLHELYIGDMAAAWAKRRGLKALNLGSGARQVTSFQGVDLIPRFQDDIKADLNERWPFENNSVGVMIANDIIEHLKDPIHTMAEAYRVLAHGGLFLIEVPSTDGRGAFQDPTHVTFWNENSFRYYTHREQADFIAYKYQEAGTTPARFQPVDVRTHFPNQYCIQNNIPYVKAHLAALKNGPRLPGPVHI